MSVWLRELAGWVLLGAGLAAFAVCYFVFLLQRRVIEAAALAFIGFTIFRGGMHLLRIAIAARAAKEHTAAGTPEGAEADPRAAGRAQEPRPPTGASRARGGSKMTADPLAGAKAVFFDAVGTVLHPVRGAPAVYADAAVRYGLPGDPAAILARFRDAYQRQEAIDEAAGWVTSETREVTRWRAIVRETLPGATDDCFDLLYGHFEKPEAWDVPAGTAGLFEELAGRGFVLGLASNYDSRLRSVLAGRLELARLGGNVVISSEVGVRKPGAAFFARLAELAGCRRDEIVLVGDDLGNDYEGAATAGMRAVLLDPRNRHPDIPMRIESLPELLR